MSDERLPFLQPAGDGHWRVCVGDADHTIGEVDRRDDGTILATRHDRTHRVVETPEEGLQFVVDGFSAL